jgi:hypothetical protein
MTQAKNQDKTNTKIGKTIPLRPASQVMSQIRAGAAYPNALSFSRNLLRKMNRENWRIETIRLELDPEGRGEALYRIDTGKQTFHSFTISDYFPPSQKIDRAFGINWDVSAAICEGDWTPEREARLRIEIPKQYDGRYDSDVLCFCRGNRSERIFDHVVERLAQGRQPDVGMLVSVGYLLRSTAFAGNGLFGMKPFEALDTDHALGGTYDVQMLAAYMLRNFVFDLSESIAAHRSTAAVQLDRRLKRYLGVGNSAGLGLIPFITTHPLIINQWCLAHEQAFAEALARNARDGEAADRFLALMERACRYFGIEERDGNDIFADYAILLRDLEATLKSVRHALSNCQDGFLSWQDLLTMSAPRDVHAETWEILYGIVLELYPDIVEHYQTRLQVENETALNPSMTASQLADIVARDYRWALEPESEATCDRFWYYPQESPYEPRRGVRGKDPALETETSMDIHLTIPALAKALRDAAPDAPVASVLAERPDLVAIATRVQALQHAPYAELRMNSLSADFRPFAACRFLLAFYGMEKYDPRLPRSTKGALMQGAPLADELGTVEHGTWPFPLPPEFKDSDATAEAALPLRLVEQPEISIKDLSLPTHKKKAGDNAGDVVTIFLQEHHKMMMRLTQKAGLAYATAKEIADAALFSAAAGQSQTLQVLDLLARNFASHIRLDGADMLDGGDLPAFAVVPRAIDLASAKAGTAGSGYVQIKRAARSPLLFALSLAAAARGDVVAVTEPYERKLHLAGPGRVGPWVATLTDMSPAWATGKDTATLFSVSNAVDGFSRLLAPDGATAAVAEPLIHVAALRLPETPSGIENCVGSMLREMRVDPVQTFTSEAVLDIRRGIIRDGVAFTREMLQRLQTASLDALLAEEIEKEVAPPV